MARRFFIFFLVLIAFSIGEEGDLALSSSSTSADRLIQQRLSRPLLLDRQTILKTETTDASINMNVGQNKSTLPGSGLQATQKILKNVNVIYENNLLLPTWGDTVSSNRYLHQDKVSMEWNLLSRTSIQTSYTAQSEYDLNQQKSRVSESKQKDFGLKGTLFKNTLWDTGYRIVDTTYDQQSEQTSLWYTHIEHPITASLGLLLQGEYSESGDPTAQDWNNEDKRLNLGSGANYHINDIFSAQLRFDLKMQEEQQHISSMVAVDIIIVCNYIIYMKVIIIVIKIKIIL
ncbi:MAG: hypothetical protein V4507_03415, partial [Verrucomicrobiota bacterium]